MKLSNRQLLGPVILAVFLLLPNTANALDFLGKSIEIVGTAKLRVCTPRGTCKWGDGEINTHLKMYIAKDGRIFDYSAKNGGLTTSNGGTAKYKKYTFKFRHSGSKMVVTSKGGNLTTTDVIKMSSRTRCRWSYNAKLPRKIGSIADAKSKATKCKISKGNKFVQ